MPVPPFSCGAEPAQSFLAIVVRRCGRVRGVAEKNSELRIVSVATLECSRKIDLLPNESNGVHVVHGPALLGRCVCSGAMHQHGIEDDHVTGASCQDDRMFSDVRIGWRLSDEM